MLLKTGAEGSGFFIYKISGVSTHFDIYNSS